MASNSDFVESQPDYYIVVPFNLIIRPLCLIFNIDMVVNSKPYSFGGINNDWKDIFNPREGFE